MVDCYICIYESLLLQMGAGTKKGRPVANPDEGPKDKKVIMRVTKDTHRRLHEAAAVEGLSLTEWLVGLGLRAAERVERAKKRAP